MSDLFAPTLADLRREIEREVAMRRSVYPGLVASGKQTQAAADRRIAVMEAVARLIKKLESYDEEGGAGARRLRDFLRAEDAIVGQQDG